MPRPLPADEGPADGPRPAADAPTSRTVVARLRELHEAYRDDYRAYYERHATPDSPPMRGADPAIVLVPGRRDVLVRGEQADRPRRRRVLRQRDQRHARRRGAVDLRADRRGGEVPDRVLGARGGEARADAGAEAAGRAGRVRDRRRLGDRQGDRPSARRRRRLRRRRRHRSRRAPRPWPRELGGTGHRDQPSSPT